MKLCIDCKYCIPKGEFSKCHHPKNAKKDPVTGEGSWDIEYCNTQRCQWAPFFVKLCGSQARWWEPK